VIVTVGDTEVTVSVTREVESGTETFASVDVRDFRDLVTGEAVRERDLERDLLGRSINAAPAAGIDTRIVCLRLSVRPTKNVF